MSEMVERIARLLCKIYVGDPERWAAFELEAREVISAMRKPTEAMIDAVYNHQPAFKCVAGHDLSSDELRDIYRAMIDEALK